MTVSFMYIFEATIFWSFIFHILVLRLGYFRSKKET